jgi:REP-associated tyrosine transposase
MAATTESLSHTRWDCKYPIVFVAKCRRAALWRDLGEMFRHLAQQKESRIEEGHLPADHGHRFISIPPKYAVSQVVGFIKGKSAIHPARNFGGRQRTFTGHHFWARGCYVSTAGRDEEVVRRYIREQQEEDKRIEQLKMFNM